MAMANRLAGCVETPPDSQVYLDGDVRRVFVGIDVDLGELLLARRLGADGVIAHHPIGSRARLGLSSVIEGHETQMRADGIPADVAHESLGQPENLVGRWIFQMAGNQWWRARLSHVL